MRATAAIAARELAACFRSPGGYVVAALYTLINGWLFVRYVFDQGEPATLRPIFTFSMVAFALICPAVTMRMVSEELRVGTIEVLLTAPLAAGQVIAGKFLAAWGFLLLLLAPTLLFVAALEIYGRPDYGELAAGYLGVALAASMYLAGGILASTLTPSQVVAYLISVLFWIILLLAAKGLPQADLLPAAWRASLGNALFSLDPDMRLRDFSIGLIDTANVVYFASITGVFLIAATMALEARRWR